MRKTNSESSFKLENAITLDAENLARYLSCGRVTAAKIGNAAHARIQIGRRVLYNLQKVRDYIDGISE